MCQHRVSDPRADTLCHQHPRWDVHRCFPHYLSQVPPCTARASVHDPCLLIKRDTPHTRRGRFGTTPTWLNNFVPQLEEDRANVLVTSSADAQFEADDAEAVVVAKGAKAEGHGGEDTDVFSDAEKDEEQASAKEAEEAVGESSEGAPSRPTLNQIFEAQRKMLKGDRKSARRGPETTSAQGEEKQEPANEAEEEEEEEQEQAEDAGEEEEEKEKEGEDSSQSEEDEEEEEQEDAGCYPCGLPKASKNHTVAVISLGAR